MRATRTLLTLTTAVSIALPGAATAQVRIQTSGGEVVMFTEKNLVDHMIVGDSVEVAMAELAVSKTQNSSVRDFANMLITDHRAHLETLRKVAAEDEVGRQPNPADTAGALLIGTLAALRDSQPDSLFDKAFIRAQIDHHTREIAALKMMRPAADDNDLERDIDTTYAVLERHLARAKQVAAELGMAVDTTGVKMPDTTAVKRDTMGVKRDTMGVKRDTSGVRRDTTGVSKPATPRT